MRKKLLLSVLISTFAVFNLTAQTRCKINGEVKEPDGTVINAATVILYNSSDSAIIKTEITDTKGNYDIEGMKSGNYFIAASNPGYENFSSAGFIIKDGESKTLPAILLKYIAKNLTEVTITANYNKPMIEVKADRTVFNIENSINATGSNAFELLQKSPGVVTDKDDNITVKGKNGARIYIDSRPTQMSNDDLPAYLRSINSADIESIEIISNPSSKYDAAGNAGVINIKLKKNKKPGFNGSVSIGLNYGKSFKYPAAFSFNYRNKKINLFSNYSFIEGNRESNLFLYRIQSDSIYNQTTQQNNKGWFHNINAGVDYFINKKSTLGFIATINLNNITSITTGNTIISPVGGKSLDSLSASNTIPGNVKNINYDLNYRFADTAGHELSLDADYGYYISRKTSTQPNYYYDISSSIPIHLSDPIFWNKTNIDINISSAKVDYETPFKNGKLGFGGKVSYVTTKNTLDFYDVINTPVFDSSQSNQFNYTENVNALYINYNKTINIKWALQAGLRAENTYSKGILTRALYNSSTPEDSVTYNYTNLFPSAAVTYTVNNNNTFNLTYSRRIDRPNYQSLNPFEIKLDELTYEKGNAFLRPQYTNTIELTHTFKNKFNTTVGYSHVKDFNARIIDTTQISHSYITQTNLSSQDIFSINFSLPFQVYKWWNIYANINAYHSLYQGVLNSGKTNVNLAIASYSLYMQQIFTLGKNYSAELTGYYDGPSIWEGTFKTNQAGGIDIGLQKKLFNKKADIKLSCSDIFYTLPWYATSNYGGANINASGNWESRMIKFNFTYHFGKSTQTTEHRTGNEEETKRTKSSEGLGGN